MHRALGLWALVALLAVGTGCRTTAPDEQDKDLLHGELGTKIPLWVDLECDANGRPIFGEYSVLKLPDEQVSWALARLDEHCRVYGTITPKGVKPELCDIRFRSRDAVVEARRCRCVPGRYVLQEGHPTSEKCCREYPEKVYCKEPQPPEPLPEEEISE